MLHKFDTNTLCINGPPMLPVLLSERKTNNGHMEGILLHGGKQVVNKRALKIGTTVGLSTCANHVVL